MDLLHLKLYLKLKEMKMKQRLEVTEIHWPHPFVFIDEFLILAFHF